MQLYFQDADLVEPIAILDVALSQCGLLDLDLFIEQGQLVVPPDQLRRAEQRAGLERLTARVAAIAASGSGYRRTDWCSFHRKEIYPTETGVLDFFIFSKTSPTSFDK